MEPRTGETPHPDLRDVEPRGVPHDPTDDRDILRRPKFPKQRSLWIYGSLVTLAVAVWLAALLAGCNPSEDPEHVDAQYGEGRASGEGRETLRPGVADDRPESHGGANPTVVEKVQRNLDTDSVVAASEVRVVGAEPGVLRLVGRVDSEQAKLRAEHIAQRVGGVERVQNELQVSER